MEVFKKRQLQIGDIVAIKQSECLGIINFIQNQSYNISPIEQVEGVYQKTNPPQIFQLENLTLYPDRELWVKVKKDLDRKRSGKVLTNWIKNL